MDASTKPEAYGALTEPTTLKIQRMLPGPIERVWAYLTESELRCKWLAAGEMEMKAGAPFEFVWRNDELNDPPASGRKASPKSTACRAGSPSSTAPQAFHAWHDSGDVRSNWSPGARACCSP